MQKPKRNITPGVEAMEGRSLPSTTIPVLTTHALNTVANNIGQIVGTLAETHDAARAAAAVSQVVSKIPFGARQLAPQLRADLERARLTNSQAGIETKKEILGDLYEYVTTGVANDKFRVVGPGSAIFNVLNQGSGSGSTVDNPAPTANADFVNIQNKTGQAIVVTVRLNNSGNPRPSITRTIPATGQTTLPFDFGTATDTFMAIDVRTANGSQPPYSLNNLLLPQPMGGYDGALFVISTLGRYFNVVSG
jgi:hypothetical protein